MKSSAPLVVLFCVAGLCSTLLAGNEDASPSTEASTPAPDKSGYTVFHSTPVALRRAFNADRPSKTDSPYTIDAGVFQIETDAANFTLDRYNVDRADVRVRTLLFGQTNFKLGLTNWMDLQIFPQGYVERRTSGRDFGPTQTQRGFGDTTVRLKINLFGNDGGKLALGFIPSLKIPTNTDDLGNRAFEPGFGLPVNLSLPGGFTLFAQTRVDVLRKDGGGRRALWSNPIGVSRTIFGNLSGYAEFYSAVSTGHGYPWVGTADVGLVYQVTPNFSVDVNSFFGLTRSADDLNVFAGFAYRF